MDAETRHTLAASMFVRMSPVFRTAAKIVLPRRDTIFSLFPTFFPTFSTDVGSIRYNRVLPIFFHKARTNACDMSRRISKERTHQRITISVLCRIPLCIAMGRHSAGIPLIRMDLLFITLNSIVIAARKSSNGRRCYHRDCQ